MPTPYGSADDMQPDRSAAGKKPHSEAMIPNSIILSGDATQIIPSIEKKSVQSCVTSPPYWKLRKYTQRTEEIGREPTVEEYVARLVSLFALVWEVLSDDGVLCVNLGDTYVRKNLMGVPWRVALTLQDQGWILRNDAIWRKTNPIPFSGTDRFASVHEHIFIFSKGPRYHFDLDSVRVPHRSDRRKKAGRNALRGPASARGLGPNAGSYHPLGKNPGDVWDIAVRPGKGEHDAVFPPEIPRRLILASTREGDIVLDPFSGSGTTGVIASELGRDFIGIELNDKWARESRELLGSL